MPLNVKHMVCFILLLYLLSGFGSAFGAFWCLSNEKGCGLVTASATCCAPKENAAAILKPAGSLLDGSHCGPCQDIELQFPTLKSRVRPLRIPFVQLSFLPTISPAIAAQTPLFPRCLPGLDDPGPLLAQRHLRTVVLLN